MSFSLLYFQCPQCLAYVQSMALAYPCCPDRSLCLMLVAKLGNLMTGHRLQPWHFLENMTQNLCVMLIQKEPE